MSITATTETPQPLCEYYGHEWQATAEPGKYQCCRCPAIGYCPVCVFCVPNNVQLMRCAKHQEQKNMNDLPQTRYKRPTPPDMLPNGDPNVTTFRRQRHQPVTEEPDTSPGTLRPSHSKGKRVLTWIVGAFLLTIGLICFVQQALVPWWTYSVADHWNYGPPPHITQYDANVGHGGKSHFLAEYYHTTIMVIELVESAQGVPIASHVYTLSGMIGGDANTIVLLLVQPGATPGKPDLVIQVQGAALHLVLHNTGTAFTQEGTACC